MKHVRTHLIDRPKTVKMRASSVIDIEKTLRGWESGWKLVAFPVLADRTVALLFELEIGRHSETDKRDTVVEERQYRVLLYDALTGKMKGEHYCFKVSSGYASTVFFRNGNLYAATAGDGSERYMIRQVWPHQEDRRGIDIGDFVNGLTADSKSNVFVTYKSGNGQDETDPCGMRVFRRDGDIREFRLP